jgi:tetratricopeptide (TPR) repeat protein
MTQLKPISTAGVPAALHKAERYRLLNDSPAAESICLDILAVDPENQSAIITLILAITDQFETAESADALRRAQELVPRIGDVYRRAYYSGIVYERRAKAQLHRRVPGSASMAADWYHKAMDCYEKAEKIRPAGNDESILRWNTCVRMLAKHEPSAVTRDEYEPALDD